MVYNLFTLYNNFSNIPLKNILLTCRIVEGKGGFYRFKISTLMVLLGFHVGCLKHDLSKPL